MYTMTPPTQLLCSCVRCDQGRRASQLCRCGQSVGRWCSKGKRGSVFSFFLIKGTHNSTTTELIRKLIQTKASEFSLAGGREFYYSHHNGHQNVAMAEYQHLPW
jgi:hypothetical protein